MSDRPTCTMPNMRVVSPWSSWPEQHAWLAIVQTLRRVSSIQANIRIPARVCSRTGNTLFVRRPVPVLMSGTPVDLRRGLDRADGNVRASFVGRTPAGPACPRRLRLGLANQSSKLHGRRMPRYEWSMTSAVLHLRCICRRSRSANDDHLDAPVKGIAISRTADQITRVFRLISTENRRRPFIAGTTIVRHVGSYTTPRNPS